MGYLDSAYRQEVQLANQWHFAIDDFNADKLVFRVQDVSIPFYKLELETKPTGEKMIKKFVDIEEVTLTIRESNDFSTFKYFQKWSDQFYDRQKRVFKKPVIGQTGGLEGLFTTALNTMTRNCTLTFFKSNPLAASIPYASTISATVGINLDSLFEKPAQRIQLINCKIVGIENLSLDYEGNALVYSITLNPEEIKYPDLNSLTII